MHTEDHEGKESSPRTHWHEKNTKTTFKYGEYVKIPLGLTESMDSIEPHIYYVPLNTPI